MNNSDGITSRRKTIYALIPLSIFILSRIRYSGLFLFLLGPILIVLLLERRGVATLGFRFNRDELLGYLVYTIIGFLLLMAVMILDIFLRREFGNEAIDFSGPADYGREFVDQILFVAGPEEVFYRGYLMTRLGDLIGQSSGLFSSSFLFGLEHFLSRYFKYGFPLTESLRIGFNAALGGVIFGWQFQKTKSIFPSLISHITQNLLGHGIAGLIFGA
jgi:membrane protease YdiL (CAAX protease family)